MVTSTPPPAASRIAPGRSSPAPSSTTASAPSSSSRREAVARARPPRPRGPAPRTFAACTAIVPTAPSAPSTSTVSPGSQLGAPRERQPRGQAGVAQRRGHGVVDAAPDVEQRVLRHERPLGHRPVRRHGHVEVDPPPVAEPADAVRPDHRGQRRRAGVEACRSPCGGRGGGARRRRPRPRRGRVRGRGRGRRTRRTAAASRARAGRRRARAAVSPLRRRRASAARSGWRARRTTDDRAPALRDSRRCTPEPAGATAMPDILVLYAGKHGHTAKVARRIAAAAEAAGASVDVHDAGIPGRADPTGYAAVVVGASIHAGHHQAEVVDWVRTHRVALDRMPSAFFSGAHRGRGHGRGRAETQRYVAEFLDATGWSPARRSRARSEYDHDAPLMRLIGAGDPTDTRRTRAPSTVRRVRGGRRRGRRALSRYPPTGRWRASRRPAAARPAPVPGAAGTTAGRSPRRASIAPAAKEGHGRAPSPLDEEEPRTATSCGALEAAPTTWARGPKPLAQGMATLVPSGSSAARWRGARRRRRGALEAVANRGGPREGAPSSTAERARAPPRRGAPRGRRARARGG